LRVRYLSPFDSRIKLQMGPAKSEAAVPGARIGWELLDPEGGSAWQETVEQAWSPGMSKYNQGSRTERGDMPLDRVITTRFDFQGRGMREAVLEEVLEGLSGAPPRSFPRALLRVGGETRRLPIKAEYAAPARQ
jgi:hypothetical protein